MATLTTASAEPTPIADSGPHIGPYPLLLPKLKDPRLHLAMVTTTLQVLGQLVFGFNLSIAQILVSIGTCAAIELVVTFRRDRVIAWPASAMLTGNGIALILRVPGTEHGDWWSMHGWWVFAGTAAFAMASKYLIRVNGRHVFNPSNFALVVCFVLLQEQRADPQVLWWGPLSPGLVLAFAVILVGSIAITRRVRQGHSAVSFWLVFATSTAIIAASGHSITANWHVGPIAGWDYWLLLVTSPEILVFLFFMITDPKTAPAGRVAQSVYGSAIALVGALIVSTQVGEFGTKVGILAGLVVLCPFVRLIERHTPAARIDADRLTRWIPTVLTPDVGGVRRLARGTAVLGGATFMALALVAFGSREGSSALDGADLGRRSEVQVDPADVPAATVDTDLERTSVQISQEQADLMAADLVLDLEIEATAIEQADAELAVAGLGGIRLAQTESAIEDTDAPPETAPRFDLDTLEATFVRTSPSPQAPPELAMRASGRIVTASGEETFDGTFVLQQVGDTHLLVDQLDENGDPVGDRSASSQANQIEAAVSTESDEAPAALLGGLEFSDVTEQVGLGMPRSAEPLREGAAAWSGGAAVADYDGDGDQDLLLTRAGMPNALYRNDAGRYVDVTGPAGLPTSGSDGSTGATWADITGDGALDLVVLGLGDTPNRLYQGSATGGFTDVTDQWGLPNEPAANPDASYLGLAVADYDRDGRVDLLVTDAERYAVLDAVTAASVSGGDPCAPAALDAVADAGDPDAAGPGSRTRLLRNTGSGFEDRTASLGIDPALTVGMTPRFADLDGDGWDDLTITGGSCTTKLLRNDGAGGFVDVTEGAGIGQVENGSGSELVDVDRDGDLDWFVSGVSYPTKSGDCPISDVSTGCSGNRLFINEGDMTFSDETDAYGVRDGYWGTGVAAGDLNLDGWTDLMQTNGFRGVATERADDGSDPERRFYERAVDDPDRLWLGAAGSDWHEVSATVGLTGTGNGKAVVPFDHDGDGLLDLLVIDVDGAPRLFRNTTATTNHWLVVELDDPGSPNRQAVGATVTVDLGGTAPPMTRRVGPDGSFQSGVPTEAQFGLGANDSVDELTVTWPDGSTTVERDVASSQVLRVTKGS